jgi:hypothetical protein
MSVRYLKKDLKTETHRRQDSGEAADTVEGAVLSEEVVATELRGGGPETTQGENADPALPGRPLLGLGKNSANISLRGKVC